MKLSLVPPHSGFYMSIGPLLYNAICHEVFARIKLILVKNYELNKPFFFVKIPSLQYSGKVLEKGTTQRCTFGLSNGK
jgi:hypothetical protein